ncbi:MAG: tRNA (guanine(6)-N2)-methyltransferase [Archaeoglobaceae archaeon]|nr:tRNA (guanine(6)-N2)-methyltransferase [Archaeoglobaceae archaeon]MCX8152747.1 tRNA (guanine(6)-N2)-methyltransferase [Archaeoglobaceae archaeon]MDW8013454.1 tRNA (guanine(6)-N2)-methyltransferase [Archaeoglobaceae archaeon]
MLFYVTTLRGVEDVTAEEIKNYGKVLEIRRGRVIFEAPKGFIPKLNAQLRCAERVVALIDRGKFKSLDELYSIVKSHDYDFIKGKSFAVRCTRVGSHNFTSIDVSRVAGQAVIDSFLEKHRERLKVNLDEPDVIVRVDVIDDEYFLGIDTTGEGLHKRWWRVYNHPAHLNAIIACAMVKLAGWKFEESLIDPMCGSGTILIEAAMLGRNISPGKNRDFAYFKILGEKVEVSEENNKIMNLKGVEKFKKHVDGAKANAEKAGVLDTIVFEVGDALKLEGTYDCIVTNPPYGLRVSRKGAIEKLYDGLCRAVKRCMHENSRFVVITSEFRLMSFLAEKNGLNVFHERFVQYGGLKTKLFIFLK